jgi:predicted dehydrogenase
VALVQGAYPAYYAALRDAMLGQGRNPVDAADALAVQAVLDAGIRSAGARAECLLTPSH